MYPQSSPQTKAPSPISEIPMLASDFPGLAEVHRSTGARQSLPKVSVLRLSGYICEISSFWPPDLTLITATSLWKYSIHRSENQS